MKRIQKVERTTQIKQIKIIISAVLVVCGYPISYIFAHAESADLNEKNNYSDSFTSSKISTNRHQNAQDIQKINLAQLNIDITNTGKEIPPHPNTNSNDINNNKNKIIFDGDSIDAQNNHFLKAQGSDKQPAQLWLQNKYIQGNTIDYNFVEDRVTSKKNVIIKDDQAVIIAPEATYYVDEERGDIKNATYQLSKDNAHGYADELSFEKDQFKLKNVTYTTCEPGNVAWYLQAKEIHIDQRENIIRGQNAKLVFLGMPLLPVPYGSFSLNNQRRSGFLNPTFSINSRSGFDIVLPYYFNIAPHYDATFYPRILSKRGLLMGSEFRYLNPKFNGSIAGEFLFNDRQTQENRWAFSIQHQHKLSENLNAYADIEKVSDKNYPNDFGKSFNDYSKQLYTQEIGLNWHKNYAKSTIHSLFRYKKYQALNYKDNPYNLMPQLNNIYTRELPYGVELNNETDFSYFNNSNAAKIEGKRAYNDLNISKSWDDIAYSIKPNIRIHASQYWLNNQQQLTKIIPSFSLDSRVFLDREFTSLKGKQTLEPRLFYLYTPYKNQNDAPLFDTAASEFGFDALFNNNRFVGHDRIADAHQLTAGVTSRWLDTNQKERLSLTIAQRYNFSDTKVNLDNKVINKGLSDTFAQAVWSPGSHTRIYTDVQYNTNTNKFSKASTELQWVPNTNQALGIIYKYRSQTETDGINNINNNTPFKQINVNALWQLSHDWRLNTNISYDLQGKSITNTFVGLDYIHNCWCMRVGFDRTIGTDGKQTTRGVFQLALKGLGGGFK
jgi:LPS-assembly protein